jgi:hypothetical protein
MKKLTAKLTSKKAPRKKAPKKPSVDGGPSWSQIWIKQEFDKLHKEHTVILSEIRKLTPSLTPELADALMKNAGLVKKVDDKVPDRNVPPS